MIIGIGHAAGFSEVPDARFIKRQAGGIHVHHVHSGHCPSAGRIGFLAVLRRGMMD
jgi:hypothetical protein